MWLRECKTDAVPEGTVTLCASLLNPAFEMLIIRVLFMSDGVARG